MIRYFLDSDICIELIRGRGRTIASRLRQQTVLRDVGLSSIALAELETGVQKSDWPIENRARLIQFCTPLVVVPFDEEASRIYGEIRAHLERLGTVIGPLDMLIAAHALSLGATLVTNNVREFARVPNLRIGNWQ